MAQTTFNVDKDKLEVRLSRVFKASAERLWQAHTDPEQIPKWWDNTKVETFDFKVGGKWRFLSGGPNNFTGEFKEIDPPRKLVRTFIYEPYPDSVMEETTLFEPQDDGTTKLTIISSYKSLQHLEGMVGMGMEGGATAGMERLAKLVEND